MLYDNARPDSGMHSDTSVIHFPPDVIDSPQDVIIKFDYDNFYDLMTPFGLDSNQNLVLTTL